MQKLDTALLQEVKQGFVPMGGGAPADPAMMGGAPPMDPAMMGGAPPMDPAMMGGDPMAGGMPPGDPMAGGAPPMDPAMMGGDPMADPAMAGSAPLGITEKGLIDIIKTVTGQPTTDDTAGASENTPDKPVKATNQSILEAINNIPSMLGVGATAEMPPEAKVAYIKNKVIEEAKLADVVSSLDKVAAYLHTRV